MKKLYLSLFICAEFFCLFAQDFVTNTVNSNYALVERTNLRQYLNGKYTGLMSREVRSFIVCEKIEKGTGFYLGNFYVEQDTVKNQRFVNNGIHDAIPSSFFIAPNGYLTMKTDNGYPTFRSFPVFPEEKIKPGDVWRGESVRAVDPLNNGIVTKIPMTVLYTLVGEEIYKNQPVYRINAEWATRYGISYWDWGGDSNLKSAQGSHKAFILVSVENGSMVFMSDNVDETFIYKDGTQLNFKGTILQFTEYPVTVEHDKILPALKRIGAVALTNTEKKNNIRDKDNRISLGSGTAKNNDTLYSEESESLRGEGFLENDDEFNGDEDFYETTFENIKGPLEITEALEKSESRIVVEETEAGIKLSVHDLKFKADSDELLPEEKWRLDEIAEVLKMASSSMFLVEGHTARTGYTEGEMKVSKARANRIAEELSNRGIEAGRFICKGWGAEKPVASNDTKEGMAMNRRVEITILE